MKKIVCLIVLLCLTWVTLTWAAQENNKIRAVGMATIHNNIVDIARDKAIDNALRNVVEKVVGVMVTGSTEVENFQLKMDRILSESKGFVENYRILSEKREGDNYEVNVEAEVGAGKLQDRLQAMQLLISRKSRPRLMVVFNEAGQKDAIAEAAMSKFFLVKGFKLVDSSIVKKSRGEINVAVSATNEKALSNLARTYGAEVVIFGSVEAVSNSFTVSGIEMFTNKVSVSVKVINGDTGDVITTGSESKSVPGAKGDISRLAEEAAGKLAGKILEDTLERWSSELTNTTTIKLVVSGLDEYQDLVGFKDHLQLVLKGFKVLYQRSYQQGTVELDIEVKGDIQGVADDLSVFVMKGRKLKISAITQNMVKAIFLPQPR
ncbi:MAG: flagellar assembly protein T N-terminal domain-containing protein [Deltaproteobacteria bacterium]|nr:flagellar assembly protein T N-terminal domain-containing protein [Deltaproteobacteria bacterium]